MAKRNSVGIYLFGKAKARLVTYTVLCGKGERSCLVFFLSEQSKEYDASPGSYEKKLKEKISWLKKERSRCIKISLDKKYDKEEKNDFRKKIDVNDYIYGKLYEICDKDVHFTIPKVASAMVYMELEETFKNFKIFNEFYKDISRVKAATTVMRLLNKGKKTTFNFDGYTWNYIENTANQIGIPQNSLLHHIIIDYIIKKKYGQVHIIKNNKNLIKKKLEFNFSYDIWGTIEHMSQYNNISQENLLECIILDYLY